MIGMGPEDEATLAAALDDLGGILDAAAALAAAGGSVDLSGLDQEAASLCEAVVRLSPPSARALLPKLDRLLTLLNQLEAAVRQTQGVGANAVTTPSGVQAAAAYRRAVDPDVD